MGCVVDCCGLFVSLQRDPVTKKLRANPKTWPRGYKALVDHLHSLGLKITAYASTGACAVATLLSLSL